MIGFGEIALLLNDRRTASITALSAEGCDAWVLAADVFKYIIASNTIRRRNINLSYLSQVELFKNIEQYEKLRLIDGLKVEQHTKDEFVFHEGDVGDNFYIIEEGECECLKTKENGERDFIRKLEVGSHFGEIAILKNVKRTLSIKVTSNNLKLLVLSREAFQRILGSIRDYLKEDYLEGQEFLDASFESDGG